MISNLEKNIESIIKDLKARNTPREELLSKYVRLRLSKSLNSYQKDLQESYSILTHRNIDKLVRKL